MVKQLYKWRLKLTWLIILFIVLISPIIFIIIINVENSSKPRIIEEYYHSNHDDLNKTAAYFKQLYSDELTHAKIGNDGTLKLEFSTSANSEIDVSSESVYMILNNLHEKYKQESYLPNFTFVRAYYDKNGNMLLYMNARSQKFNKSKKTTINDYRAYYLVYIDENYNGVNPSIAINSYSDKKPFTDNWFTWSDNFPIG